MAKKVAEEIIEENQVPAVDPQKKYLMDQFGSLMEQVGEGFGGPLQEELIRRLEQTIADFHQEVNEMLTTLKDTSEKRHAKLKEIWDNPDSANNEVEEHVEGENSDSSNEEKEDEPAELSDWEKRLEALDSSKKKSEVKDAPKEKPTKKKGFFGRKKK
jgi:DNA repair ATPase RecN